MLRALQVHGVEYVLIGGLAAFLLGSPIATQDADITPEPSPENLARLMEALGEMGAQLRVPGSDVGIAIELSAEWFRSMTSMTFITQVGMLDVVVRPDGQPAGFADLVDDAVTTSAYGVTFRIASLPDVIASKTAAGRPKDHAVLAVLREVQRQREERHRT